MQTGKELLKLISYHTDRNFASEIIRQLNSQQQLELLKILTQKLKRKVYLNKDEQKEIISDFANSVIEEEKIHYLVESLDGTHYTEQTTDEQGKEIFKVYDLDFNLIDILKP